MNRQSSLGLTGFLCPRLPALIGLFLLLAALGSPVAAQQPVNRDDPDRKRALELFDQHKILDALPFLEKLAMTYPEDIVVQEHLGFAVLSHAASRSDPLERQTERRRARQILLHAKEMGDKSDLLTVLLEGLPADGGNATISERADVEAVMRRGESAFTNGDFDAAIAAYQQALELDPHLYEAPLFIGDTYFKKKEMDKAGKWFAVAVALDPNRETAYRYWADALLSDGKLDEARDKFIDGLIAEPYTQKSWVGLGNWARRANVQLSHPRIESPNQLKTEGKETKITIDAGSLDAKDGTSAWMNYEISRAAWQVSLFRKEFPGEKDYRHSLREEADALRLVALSVEQQKKDKKIKTLDPALAKLVELIQKGLLEAYVLLAKPDDGIVKDYPSYREAHREELRRYLREYVTSKDK